MTEDLQLQPITIQNKIYEIRSQKVMLDFDLAELYGVETKRLKEAVRRNIERFEGDDFMFQLSKKEWHEFITNCDALSEFKDIYVFICNYLCFSNFYQLAW